MPLYSSHIGPTGPDLTGPITSVGAATAVAPQTGTGTKFVMDSGPAFAAGTASAGTWPKMTAGTPLVEATVAAAIDEEETEDMLMIPLA